MILRRERKTENEPLANLIYNPSDRLTDGMTGIAQQQQQREQQQLLNALWATFDS